MHYYTIEYYVPGCLEARYVTYCAKSRKDALGMLKDRIPESTNAQIMY